MKARDLVNGDVVTVGSFDDLELAGDTLRGHRIDAAPVVDDDGRLVGIITLADLVIAIHEGEFGHQRWTLRLRVAVNQVMRTPVVSLTPGATIEQVEMALDETFAPLIPITDGRTIIGTITKSALSHQSSPPAAVPGSTRHACRPGMMPSSVQLGSPVGLWVEEGPAPWL